MKKLTLLLSFLVCLDGFTQTVKPFNLKDFEGKKIVSLFKSTTEIRGSLQNVPALGTNQYHTISRSISFLKKDEKTLVDKSISNVKVKVENVVTLEGEEFDTDKKFDRTTMSSMVYGQYDKFILKPFKMIYDFQNKRVDTLSNFKENNFYFDAAWSDGMMPYLQEDFIGFFQLSLPTGDWKIGQTWQQILVRKSGMGTKNENIINSYTVKSIIGSEITLEVKGVNTPGQIMLNRTDGYVENKLDNRKANSNDKVNYTVEQKTDYQGIIKLDSKNNFINKLEIGDSFVRKIQEKDKPLVGPEVTHSITIENTLEDLK